jgi:hypothetical protein
LFGQLFWGLVTFSGDWLLFPATVNRGLDYFLNNRICSGLTAFTVWL